VKTRTSSGAPDAPPDAAADDRSAVSGAARFERRRSDIIAAAIPVLNGHGFKGMRLTDVAELIGLRSTGVTYYFPRKEELAVACLESGMAIIHELLEVAEKEADAVSRVSRFIELFVARDAAVRRGEATPLASFGPLSALEGPHRAQVVEGYGVMFRRVRALFKSPANAGAGSGAWSIRTLILLEQLYWSNAWLGDHDLDEFPRLARCMTDLVVNGLARPGSDFSPVELRLFTRAVEADASKDSFLLAATRQINAHGYRGASIDRISASLNMTKGAFYHYNDAKDDLVAACFRRSFGIVREAQRQVREQDMGDWRKLVTAVAALFRFQLSPDGPLLRTSVLSSMPKEHQVEIVKLSYKVGRTFASMIADAIADGGARPVDPTIASHMLSAAVNVASEFSIMRPASDAADPAIYAQVLMRGLIRP